MECERESFSGALGRATDTYQMCFTLPQESSLETETNGSRTGQGPGYTVDASKLSSQALSIFAESLKICVVLRCRDGKERLSCLSILVVFSIACFNSISC